MNLLDLLRGGGQSTPQPNTVVPPDPEEIVVQGAPKQGPKIQRGFLGGPFAVGTTGGNILGVIGDAFLAQAGRAPMYDPRVRQAQLGEAVQDYRMNPEGALDNLLPLAPELGMEATETRNRNQAYQQAQEAAAQLNKDKQDEITLQRGLQLVGASKDPETYVRNRELMKNYFVTRNFEAPFELPETWEEAQDAIKKLSVPIEEQFKEEGRETRSQRSAETSRGNNQRSTSTSAANNQRSVAASNERARLAREQRESQFNRRQAGGGQGRGGNAPRRSLQNYLPK